MCRAFILSHYSMRYQERHKIIRDISSMLESENAPKIGTSIYWTKICRIDVQSQKINISKKMRQNTKKIKKPNFGYNISSHCPKNQLTIYFRINYSVIQ